MILLERDKERRIKPEQIMYHPFFKDISIDDIKNNDNTNLKDILIKTIFCLN